MQNPVEQTRADRFAGMRRYNCAPSVSMTQEMVGAPDPNRLEARFGKRSNQRLSRQSWQPAHAATVIRCTPMKVDVPAGGPSTSRYKLTASRIRSITVSSDFAWV